MLATASTGNPREFAETNDTRLSASPELSMGYTYITAGALSVSVYLTACPTPGVIKSSASM